jgi:uncharacterized membrane protein YfcA
MSLTIPGIVLLSLCAFLLGVTKTGLPGMGILVVPLAAAAMPVRESTGFILPLIIAGDCLAVLIFRRKAVWKYIFRLAPWTLGGVLIGFFILGILGETDFKPVLGGALLLVLAVDLVRRFKGGLSSESRIAAALIGLVAGCLTMIANAAGPLIAVYLLSVKLPKEEYVGTGAWFFFIVNLVKVPFSAGLGLISLESLKLNLMLLPVLAIGAVLGYYVLKKLSQNAFTVIAYVLAGLGGLKLMFF